MKDDDPQIILRQWRTTILNVFLGVVAVISLPAIGTIIISAVSEPKNRPIAIAFSVVELFLIALAVMRGLPVNFRVGGLWVIGYTAAILNLARTGLSGAGPLYLLVIPILILILVGKRASFFTAIFSGLLAIGCAILVEQGLLVPDLTARNRGMSLATIIMFLIIVMTILILFYRLQERLIADERRAQANLRQAQALLEEQNVTLEQKVDERTQELKASSFSLEQRNSELAIINSVQAALASKLELQDIYELIGEKVREVFNIDVIDIVTYDPVSNLLSMPYSYEKGDRSVFSPREPYGFRLQAIESREPVLINQNFFELAARQNNPLLTGDWPKSALFVPLLVDGKVKSIISIQNMERENAFSSSDVRLLQTLANAMGVALENAHLFSDAQHLIKEAEQRNSELAIINKIQQALASQLDFQSVIDLFGNEILRIFPPDKGKEQNYSALIALYDADTNLINFPYLINGEGTHFSQPEMELGPGLTSTVIRSGQPLVMKTLEEQIAHGLVDYADERIKARSQSWLGVPIRSGDRVIGVFSVEDPRLNLFTEADVQLLSTLAASLGVALEKARLFDETQRLLKETDQRAAELATINTVSSALISELDINALINLVGEQIRSIFKPDIAYVALLDRENQIINFLYQYGDTHEPLPLGQGLTSKVIQSGTPLLINRDIEQRRKELGTKLVGRSVRSFLGVPVFVSGEAVGVISVQDATQEDAFNEKDQHLLSTIAANVGIALQNARLFEEIKHQEHQAHEMQLRLADIISFLPDATLVINHEGKVIAWNRAIEEMTGIPAANMLGKSNYEYALPFYGERRPILIDLVLIPQEEFEREKYAHIERSGEILTGETITPALKGGARFLYATASALRDSHGTVVGAIEVIRDITDRKNAEEALRKSEHLYRSVIDNSVDVFYRADREGNIVLASPSGATLLGYDSVQDLIGLNLLRDVYVNPEDREPLLAEIQKHGFVRNFETKIKRRDGTPVVVLVNSRAYVDENGKTLGIEGFLRDFSDRKRMEDDLHRAKAEAEQANHAKSAFLANMSHELRTPLNAIIGFTRIVHRKGEGVLPEKQIENLDKVLASADNLLSLINTVLDIAKIEAGRMDVLPANFRILPLIDLCANTAQPLLRPTVTLEKQVDEGLTYIYSDQDKIRQIILNLLSNAAKFTHEGKITLTADQVGKNLHIAVTDTGIGISTEALSHIFKEFEQADATTTRKYGGTGLGLTISRNLARLLGGDLTVESESGQGSTFTLVIPVHYERDLSHLEAAALSASDPQPAHVSETAQRAEAGSAQKHILVIDDDPDAVYLLQENLEQQEFEVSGCCNGLDGLQMARQQQPQAILLDILMPGADGWQVLHDLKNDPTTANIPVILHTIVDKKALGFQLGAAAYLLKPLDPVAVRETLERVIIQNGHSPKRVLVVDDDPNVADMLRQFLAESDFSLESAQDGLAGLKSIETNRPDILLLDLIMPNLDGFGVIDRLRSNPQTRDLPIIVISAKDLNGEEVSRLKETVAVVMKKQGFEGEKLVEEINRVLRREA